MSNFFHSIFHSIGQILEVLNPYFWTAANILVALILVVQIIFVVMYRKVFNPFLTTVGKYIFLFMLSLIIVIGLVFIGIFINPREGYIWWHYPGDIFVWRPIVRFLGFGFTAFAVSALTVVLWLRRYHPERLKIAPETDEIIPIDPKGETQ